MTQVLTARPAAIATPTPPPTAARAAVLAETVPARFEPTHLLHFESLASHGTGLAIPCDPQGRVGLDALGDKLRNDYFCARALIGCLFARPTVRLAMPMTHA